MARGSPASSPQTWSARSRPRSTATMAKVCDDNLKKKKSCCSKKRIGTQAKTYLSKHRIYNLTVAAHKNVNGKASDQKAAALHPEGSGQ